MSGILSQEEIDALLNRDSNSDGNVDKRVVAETELTETEKDTLGEIGNISMGASATALYEIVGKNVSITTPKVSTTNMNRLSDEYPTPFVAIEVKYISGIEGYNVLIMNNEDVLVITDLLLGGDGLNVENEIDELRLSAMGEIMNQMVGSSSTSLSKIVGDMVNIESPKVYGAQFGDNQIGMFAKDEPIVRISFRMVIEDLIDSKIMQIMPLKFAKDLVGSLLKEDNMSEQNENQVQKEKVEVEKINSNVDIPSPQSQKVSASKKTMEHPSNRKVNVSPLDLNSFDEAPTSQQGNDENINMLLDVPLPITIELGKSKKLIKEILELNEGSVVVLDKFAGDLVDVVINGKKIAKGEVVVIDDNYGVRITDIVSSSDRV